MIWQWRLAFVLFFFLCWCVLGLLAWAIAAVASRGRGALLALPVALAAASAAGVLVPMFGQRDVTGFVISLGTATLGGAVGAIAGLAFHRRLRASQPAAMRPVVAHKLGSQRPLEPEPPASTSNPQPPAS